MRDRYIDIQTAVKSSDTIGGQTVVYSSEKKIWAAIRTMKPDRVLEYGQSATMRGYEIDIPYYLETVVGPDDQIVYDSRVLKVHSIIDNDERRNVRTIIAFEKQNVTSNPNMQYKYYIDGDTEYRTGTRDGEYVIDKKLTSTGWGGTEGTDWENVSGME